MACVHIDIDTLFEYLFFGYAIYIVVGAVFIFIKGHFEYREEEREREEREKDA